MLQAIRDKAKGWVAYAIIGFISIPFAFWGIDQYLSGGGSRPAAIVNGEEIPTQEVQNQLLQIKEQFGQFAAQMDDNALKQMALDNVINQRLLDQVVKEGGYRASNEEIFETIAGIKVFQKEGKFDKAQYESFLQMQRRTPATFEEQMRADLSKQQFRDAVGGTGFVTKAQADVYQRLRGQKRDLETFTIKLDDYLPQVAVTDEQIAQVYEQNKARYMTEEQVKLAYLELKMDTMAQAVEINDDVLLNYYEENADRYITPEERSASHILAVIDDNNTMEAAKIKIDKIYAAIQDGTTTFEEAARTQSDDALAAENNGSLGAIVAGDWDKAFEDVVFTLEQGIVAQPVKTESGFEIIRVDAIKVREQQSFEQAKTSVEEDYRRDEADKAFLDQLERVQTLAYEQNGDLAPAADASGLNIQETDWIKRSGGQGIASNPKIMAAAFSDDVLAGRNSELLELAEGHAVVVRLLERQAAAQKPLDAVKADIVASVKAQEARKLVLEKGEAALAQIKTANNWSGLGAAGVGDASAVQAAAAVERNGSQLDKGIVDKAFALSRPAADAVTWGNVVQPNGDYVLIAVKSVMDGTAAVDDNAIKLFGNAVGSRELTAMMDALRQSADIETFPDSL